MGLLSRVLKTEQSAETVLGSLNHRPGEIDFPAAVFGAFRSLTGFGQGLLLLPDLIRGSYVPWLSEGVDDSVISGLQIPLNTEISEDISPAADLAESQIPEHFSIIRTGPPDSVTALLAAEISLDQVSQSEIRKLNDALGEGIHRSRDIINYSKDDLQAAEWLDKRAGQPGDLGILDISRAVAALKAAVPGICCPEREISGLVRHVSGRLADVYGHDTEQILLFFPQGQLVDRELFLHQLSAACSSVFHHRPESLTFQAVFHVWPKDRSAVEKVLPDLF